MTQPHSTGSDKPASDADMARLLRAFADVFAMPPAVVARAPGRVNLIGEHTDYNDGFVLPMAIEQCTYVAAAPRTDGQARAVSSPMNARHAWPVAAWNAAAAPAWTSYIAGVADLLRKRGMGAGGFDMFIHGDVPIGVGLSSSAALEVAAALALSHLAGLHLAPAELADLCRQAEHQYAGVPCGIMDQYVCVLGRAGAALLLDCRSLTCEHIPLRLGEYVVLVIDSGVRHELAASGYADRRRQCQAAVECFRRINPRWKSLRDVPLSAVREHRSTMDPIAVARAMHVCSENERTLAAADTLRSGDLRRMGQLMTESHRSLRDDYEVSCAEVDRLVEIVSAVPGVLGARMTGGGFGGGIVAVAPRSALDEIATVLRHRYDAAGEAKSRMIVTSPGPGAAVEYAA